MYTTLGRAGNLHDLLQELDQELADEAWARGCPQCGGRLHQANYPRKPRGGPQDLRPEYNQRLSFCCAEEGCRRRTTPPSVRFLGRRVYLGVAVVVLSALHGGQAERHASRLHELLGTDVRANRRTLARWLAWWRERLPQSTWWQVLKGHLQTPVCTQRLPTSLLERFDIDRDAAGAMLSLLRQLSPLSIGPLVTLSQGG